MLPPVPVITGTLAESRPVAPALSSLSTDMDRRAQGRGFESLNALVVIYVVILSHA